MWRGFVTDWRSLAKTAHAFLPLPGTASVEGTIKDKDYAWLFSNGEVLILEGAYSSQAMLLLDFYVSHDTHK